MPGVIPTSDKPWRQRLALQRVLAEFVRDVVDPTHFTTQTSVLGRVAGTGMVQGRPISPEGWAKKKRIQIGIVQRAFGRTLVGVANQEANPAGDGGIHDHGVVRFPYVDAARRPVDYAEKEIARTLRVYNALGLDALADRFAELACQEHRLPWFWAAIGEAVYSGGCDVQKARDRAAVATSYATKYMLKAAMQDLLLMLWPDPVMQQLVAQQGIRLRRAGTIGNGRAEDYLQDRPQGVYGGEWASTLEEDHVTRRDERLGAVAFCPGRSRRYEVESQKEAVDRGMETDVARFLEGGGKVERVEAVHLAVARSRAMGRVRRGAGRPKVVGLEARAGDIEEAKAALKEDG